MNHSNRNTPGAHGDVVAFPLRSSDGALSHISPSAIRDYLQCSLRYYFKHVLELAEPWSVSLHLSKAVHAGIQAYWLARARAAQASTQAALSAYRRAFAVHEKDAFICLGAGQREMALAQGEQLLRAYCQSAHTNTQAQALAVAVKLQDDFPELPSPLLGYVELVMDNHHGLVVCEFTLVDALPDLELESFQHEAHLCAYQLLLEAATGQRVTALEWVFLVKTKRPKIIVHRLPPASKAAQERFWQMAQAMSDGVYHERWYPQPGMHCGRCPYREPCSHWRTGGSDVD